MTGSKSQSLLDDFPLDVCGQQERINHIYTQLTLCFPIPHDTETTRSEVLADLNRGLSQLAADFPWTAGQVSRGEDGVFRIRPSQQHLTSRLVVKDFRNDAAFPDWDELQANGFPFRSLDEDVIAPCSTVVDPGACLAVLLVQANFIRNGLLLTVNAQHGSMDMAGLGQVIALLAKAMRGEAFSKEEIERGNTKRTGWIPPLEDTASSGPQPQGETSVRGDDAPDRTADGPLLWAYLGFTGEDLERLRQCTAAADSRRVPSPAPSRDDALTALVWRAIARARAPGPGDPGAARTTLTRNVDARRHFGLPPRYPGCVVGSTSHASAVGALLSRRPPGSVAAELRAALRDAGALRHGLRARATARAGSLSATGGAGLDVKVSSWAKEAVYGLDFGPLFGRPAAVRRPRFSKGAREGLVYFLPKTADGEVVVGVCLWEEDMQRFKACPEVVTWARWIG